MRLFLDANVIFSAAHNSAGNARGLFQLAQQQRCELVTSPYALEEAQRNILLKYPDRAGEFEHLLPVLTVAAEALPDRVAWAVAQCIPVKDAPILAAAVQSQVDLLVTGDRTHFGHLYGQVLQKVVITTPAAALDQVLDEIAAG